MLTQSSSAEVFYDKIRQELRVTSVHQCDSLKSLGRIIGAVTVAFLEEAPKYGDEVEDEEDKVESSDQAYHCVLDRSKVWEGIPASLSLIPMPGTTQRSFSDHKPNPQAQEQRSSCSRRRTSPGRDETTKRTGIMRECETSGSRIRDTRRDDEFGDNTDEEEVTMTEKECDLVDLSKIPLPRHLNLKESVKPTIVGQTVNSDTALKKKLLTDKYKYSERNAQDDNPHVQPKADKLSSPSVSNSIDVFWRPDYVQQDSSPESSTAERDSLPTGKPQISSSLQMRRKMQGKFHDFSFKDSDRIHEGSRKDIENVTVKQEVFLDLCHSSDEVEEKPSSVTKCLDNDDDMESATERDYHDGENSGLFMKSSKKESSLSSTYLYGDPSPSFYNMYPGIGETAFPRSSSTDLPHHLKEAVHSSGGFPFLYNHPSLLSSPSALSASASHRYSSSLMAQTSSSVPKLQLKSHGRKSMRKLPSCAICFAEIKDKNDFATHASLHSLEDQHNCPVCLKIFSNRANLLRHSALHILGVLYQCPICCKMIKRGDNFQVHMRKQHPGQSVRMARVVSGYSSDHPRKSLFASTRSSDDKYHWHGKSATSIKQEPESFSDKPYLYSDPDIFSALKSQSVADSSSEKQSLDLSMHPRPCPYCEAMFTSTSDLVNHLQESHIELSTARGTGSDI